MQKLLDEIGLNSRRIQMINVSAAMAGQFAWAAAEMTAEIKNIGPNPLGEKKYGMPVTKEEGSPGLGLPIAKKEVRL